MTKKEAEELATKLKDAIVEYDEEMEEYCVTTTCSVPEISELLQQQGICLDD